MRRLAAALLLLAPLSARAQTDAALIDRVVAALRVAEQVETSLATGLVQTGREAPYTSEAVVDSIRAALFRDLRPDLLRDALPFLQSPAYARLVDSARESAENPGAVLAATMGAMFGGTGPKKGTLADSLLAARFVEAAGTERQMIEVTERSMRMTLETVPGARAGLEEDGQTADEAVTGEIEAMRGQMAPILVAAARVQFAGVPVGDVEAAIAYYESAAGQYLTRAQFEGTLAAALPGAVRMGAELAGPFEESTVGARAKPVKAVVGPAAPGPRKG